MIIYDMTRPITALSPKKEPFHRRQFLYLAKAAMKHCPEYGENFIAAPIDPGLILLMISDQFHIQDRSFMDSVDEVVRSKHLLSEFIAVDEYSGADTASIAVQAFDMIFIHPRKLLRHPDFIDFEKVFLGKTGLDLRVYFAMCLSLLVGNSVSYTAKIGYKLFYPSDYWQKSNLSIKTQELFWLQVGATREKFRAEIVRRDCGANDFTIFRQHPLIKMGNVYFGLDLAFILQKLWAGAYWEIFSSSEDAKSKLPRFWGAVFEEYINEILGANCQGENHFIPSPRFARHPEKEFCDGMILCGTELVMIEYKASMFTAVSKYSGVVENLDAEITLKLITNERGKAKGGGQLARSIALLRSEDRATLVEGVDLSQVTKIFPLVLMSDSIGDCLLISKILGAEFDKVSTRSGANIICERLLCTGCATLNDFVHTLRTRSMSSWLAEWDRKRP
ncbi:hypothetical protein [Granulicella arctica]|uniref:hypothetical protein n=1 Tax=Granulicella arctica TaxID=940613 RepID=UPI0021DFE927|nr:hypothetical protein [Granulicella arctica]